MSDERVDWWKVEDPGGWPPQWRPPYEPSLSRPPTNWWFNPLDFRLRPHP